MSLHANVINIIELIENVCQDQSMSFSPLTPVSATKLLAVKARAHKVQIHHMHVQIVHTIVTVAPVDLEQQTAFSDHASTSHTPLT